MATELCGILVSELSDIGDIDGEELCSESLFLVSQKTDSEQSLCSFISRKMKYGNLKTKIRDDLSILQMQNTMAEVVSAHQTSSYLSCNCEFPYILSSYSFKNFGLVNAQGYPLSAGMDIVLRNTNFDTICCDNLYTSGFDKLYARKSGDVFTGNVLVSATLSTTHYPTLDNEVATKKYVDEHSGGGSSGGVKKVNGISPDSTGNVALTCYTCEIFNFYTKADPTTPIPYKMVLSA